MRDNWFIQGLITNGAYALLVLAGGAVVAVLARNASLWATPVLYGLGGSALLSVSIFAFKAMGRLPAKRTTLDVDNVGRQIRLWLDNFRVPVQNDPTPDTYFRFIVTTTSGTRIAVGRPREFSGYIVLRGEVTPSPDEQRAIQGLSVREANRVLSELRLEMARANSLHRPGTPYCNSGSK